MKNAILLASVTCLFSPPVVCAQNLIANGDFESPSIAANTISGSTLPTGWTGGSFNAILNGTNPPFPTPIEGQQATAVATSETLSQVFTASSDALHTLRWFDAIGKETGGPTAAPYSVAIVAESDSQTVFSADLDAFHDEEWLERVFQVDLISGDYSLQFAVDGNSVGGVSPILDDVSVTAIPEPSTVALVGCATGLLCILRKKKH